MLSSGWPPQETAATVYTPVFDTPEWKALEEHVAEIDKTCAPLLDSGVYQGLRLEI